MSDLYQLRAGEKARLFNSQVSVGEGMKVYRVSFNVGISIVDVHLHEAMAEKFEKEFFEGGVEDGVYIGFREWRRLVEFSEVIATDREVLKSRFCVRDLILLGLRELKKTQATIKLNLD